MELNNFEKFFQGWLVRQQNYLHQLKSTLANLPNKPELELNALVSQVLSHYQQYYAAKSTVAHAHNVVFMMFAPPWFSSFEHTCLWITGFKPGLAFKLVKNSVRADFSSVQLVRMDRLITETSEAERELKNEMARVQESLAAPPIVKSAMMRMMTPGRRVDKEIGDVDDAIQELRKDMEALVENADTLRMTTVKKVVEILSPVQAVEFLTAATQLQLKIHTWGWRREAATRARGGANYVVCTQLNQCALPCID